MYCCLVQLYHSAFGLLSARIMYAPVYTFSPRSRQKSRALPRASGLKAKWGRPATSLLLGQALKSHFTSCRFIRYRRVSGQLMVRAMASIIQRSGWSAKGSRMLRLIQMVTRSSSRNTLQKRYCWSTASSVSGPPERAAKCARSASSRSAPGGTWRSSGSMPALSSLRM